MLACLPETQGKSATAVMATNLARTFPSIEWRLLVGTSGRVWSTKRDILLGDVVISTPDGTHSGVIQYDLGNYTTDGFVLKSFLTPLPSRLRGAAEMMRLDHLIREDNLHLFIYTMLQKGDQFSGILF